MNPLKNNHFKTAGLAGLLISAALFLHGVYMHWTYLEDDPLIDFRYAMNFHSGHGWVFNLGEHVNGCTSFFGLVLTTILSDFFSIDTSIVVLKILGIVAGLVILWQIQRIAQILLPEAPLVSACAPLLLAYRTDFPLSMINGLETPYACVFLLSGMIAVYHARLEDRETGYWKAAGLFCFAGLSRPELVPIFPVLLGVIALSQGRLKIKQMALYFLPFIGLGFFNYIYYGSPLPNTYYAKVVDLVTGLILGGEYLAQYLLPPTGILSAVVGVLCLLAVASRQGKFTPIFFTVVFLYAAFLLRTSGDWMVDGRFAMPVLPLIIVSWLVGLYVVFQKVHLFLKGNRLACTCLMVLLAVFIATEGYLDNRARNMYISQFSSSTSLGTAVKSTEPLSEWMCGAPTGRQRIAEWIKENVHSGESVAMPEMGLIPCLNPDVGFIDFEGLTDATIAHLPGYHHGPFGVYAGQDWDSLDAPMGRYIEYRHPAYVVSAYRVGEPIRNPNYIKVATIRAHIDINGWHNFLVYKRRAWQSTTPQQQ